MQGKKIATLFIVTSILLLGCQSEHNLPATQSAIADNADTPYSLIEEPITVQDKKIDNFWGTRMKLSENLEHIYCLQKGEKIQWKSYSLQKEKFVGSVVPWNKKIQTHKEDEIVNIVQESNAENVYICIKEKKKYFLYQYSGQTANMKKSLLKEKLKLLPYEVIDDMLITPKNNLVFFTSKQLKDGGKEYGSMILYNPKTDEIIGTQHYISPGKIRFDENESIYYLDEYQNCIIEKKFGSNQTQSVIPLNGLCQLDWNSKLDVRDGKGAIYTASGIFTGEMNGRNWHLVIDSNQFYKDKQDYYINDFVMVSGEESEYYVFVVFNDNETVKWVHYY